ncbi:unnamed protein product [Oikopleura dioica]|uniref:Uncharacterized protein n=1 Tax=Oikopleura dioica TaxID=34765 RepID=E4WYC7_OIKDI|nr:unnamed protein product [Oikopleura dioica]CBY33877.1 unnamed protein product [Oikopleura dioica]
MFVQKTMRQTFGISKQMMSSCKSAIQRDHKREAQKFQALLNESEKKENKFPYFRNVTKVKITPPKTGQFF